MNNDKHGHRAFTYIGNVTDIGYMFGECAKLNNVSAVNDWDLGYRKCYDIKRIGTWYNGTFTPTT